MKNPRNVFKTTKIRAAEIASVEDMPLIENLFTELEAKKTDAVEAQRAAAVAQAVAQQKQAERIIIEQKLIAMAAARDNQIANEPHWMVYKDSDGDICFEGVTERLLRNTMRAQTQAVGKSFEDDNGFDSMFETDD
jgi:hypothetical protein